MAPDKVEAEKQRYFTKLAALNDSSDEENASSDIREVLRMSKKVSSLPSISKESVPERSRIRTKVTFKKVSRINRTTPAPVASTNLVRDAPSISKKTSLRRSESPTPSALESSIVEETTVAFNSRPISERRTVSDPTIGSDTLILLNSAGIKSLLGKRKPTGVESVAGKKKSRKETTIQSVPEVQQIFKGKTFCYVPPDDIAPHRRTRITKAQEYGASWTKNLTPTTTHIVVEKTLTFKNVLDFLKIDKVPEGVVMVDESYPIDCIHHRMLFDPDQRKYAVKGQYETSDGEGEYLATSQSVGSSLKLKATNPEGKEGTIHPDHTPPRGLESTQVSRSKVHPKSTPHSITQGSIEGTATMEISPGASADYDECYEPQNSIWRGDSLDKMIKIARSNQDISIEDDEDERVSSRSFSEDSGTEDERERPTSRGKKKTGVNGPRKSSFNQENFSCMTGGTGITPESNPNGRTIEVLQKMCDYYDRSKDPQDYYRQISYRKAIGQLRKQFTKICTYDQAFALPSIGDRIAAKIEEIVLTNRLRRLENAALEPSDHILQIFTKIYNVGINQGWKWVLQGYKSLEDLKAHAQLTDNQHLGIEHYDDFLQRIPREEVTALGDIVKANSAAVDSMVKVIIGGSYRRGASDSGDIDCLLTKPGTSSSHDLLPFLHQLVAKLTEVGFLKAALAVPSTREGGGSKWHGCCVLPGSPKSIWRRIDFLLVPETELGAALIYFTGDDIFNRSIRLLAGRKGWRLNQRGLYQDVMRGPGRQKLNEGTLMEGADEKKIFALLDVPWRPPTQRICH